MLEEFEIRFTLSGKRLDPEAIKQKLGDKINDTRLEDGVYVVSFGIDAEHEDADQLWLMFCEIGAAFPGATLVE